MGQEVTIDGTVTAEGAHAVYVDAKLLVAGAADQRLRDQRTKFAVRTAAGEKITVKFAAGASVQPERDAEGPWREIKQHPTHPTGDFHPDGFVRLRGSWLVPGEHVRVIGRVTEADFVPDTGGEREAPEQRVTAIEALAVGVGEDAAEQVIAAKERYVEATTPAPARAKTDPRVWLVRATWSLSIASLVLIGLEPLAHAKTLGLGLTVGFCALLFVWWSAPDLVAFPGGASSDATPESPDVVVGLCTFLLLVVGVFSTLLAHGNQRIAAGAAGLVFIGLMPIGNLLSIAVPKPRAVPGKQMLLPAGALRRRIVVGGTIVVFIASIVAVIVAMSQ